MDKVSVITTYYNTEEFLLNAVNSVNKQKTDGTFEIEYILVNDCSTDISEKLLQAYINKEVPPEKRKNWKLFTPEKNLGCGGARKFGIEHSTGAYVAFLDADDYYIKNDFILRAHADIIREGADVVEYGMRFNRANGQVANNCAVSKTVLMTTHDKEIALFKDNLIKFNVWTKIYRRKIVGSHPYSDSRTFEDVRTVPVWIANAGKVVIMPSVEINYRAAKGSIIREDMLKTRIGTITAISEHFERFKDDYDILKAMYQRALVDLEAMLHNHSSENPGFNEMSRLNTYMLKYLYPDSWQEKVFHIEDEKKEESFS